LDGRAVLQIHDVVKGVFPELTWIKAGDMQD
jgi:hypothetical protein